MMFTHVHVQQCVQDAPVPLDSGPGVKVVATEPLQVVEATEAATGASVSASEQDNQQAGHGEDTGSACASSQSSAQVQELQDLHARLMRVEGVVQQLTQAVQYALGCVCVNI